MKIFRYIAFLLIIYGTPLCGAMAELWRAAEAGNRDHVAVELLRKVNEWKYKNGVEIIREVLPAITEEEANIIVDMNTKNVLCARIFMIENENLIIQNIPYIFISGESMPYFSGMRQFIKNSIKILHVTISHHRLLKHMLIQKEHLFCFY